MNINSRFIVTCTIALMSTACGGGGGGGNPVSSANALGPSGYALITQVSVDGGILRLYADNKAFLTTASGSVVPAYSDTRQIVSIREVLDGVQTQFADGSVYLSVDGLNLGGGGTTSQLPVWKKLSSASPFGPRDSARGIKFGGKTLLSGGFFQSPATSYFDLWSSSDDGQNWTLAFGTTTAEVGPRGDFYDPYSPIVSDGQSLYALGSTIWKSSDSITWTVASTAGPQTATDDSHGFYINGNFVFFDTGTQTIYTSPDAVTWTTSGATLPMNKRCGSTTTIAFSKIWLFGGGDCSYGGVQNDIWISDDGINWSQPTVGGAPKRAEWPARMWPCITSTSNGTLWLFGGYTPLAGNGENMRDLWYSKDGLTWKQLVISDTSVQWRHAPTCFAHSDPSKLLIVAGKAGSEADNSQAAVQNDIATLELPVDDFLP